MRQLRSLIVLTVRGEPLARAGASSVLARFERLKTSALTPYKHSFQNSGLFDFRISSGFASRSDDDGEEPSARSESSTRWASGGRKAQSGWEAEQLARPATGGGAIERVKRRQGSSHRDDLSARMDADDEALRQELLGFGPEGEAEGNTQADLDRGTHSEPAAAAAAEGLGAAGAAEELPPTETAAGLQVADDAAADQGDLVETSLAGGENIGGSDSDSDSDDSSSDSDSEEVDEGSSHAPSSSIGRQAINELEGSASDLAEIMAASKKKQRFMLQQKLMSKGNQEDLAEDLRPPDTGDFRMKIVDVNRTSKGGRAGRIMGCSALVVVGNNDGILGHGTGKATEAKAAVDKATRRAIKSLSYVPRFREHTIYYPTTVQFGKTKLIMYPLSSCRGLRCSDLMASICQLAGIKDIGIKIQGSRNLRNSVMALFKAFDQMQDRVDESSVDATPSPEWPNDKWRARQKLKLERLNEELAALNAAQKKDEEETAILLDILKEMPQVESTDAR